MKYITLIFTSAIFLFSSCSKESMNDFSPHQEITQDFTNVNQTMRVALDTIRDPFTDKDWMMLNENDPNKDNDKP